MKKRSKSYRNNLKEIEDLNTEYQIADALTIIRKISGDQGRSIRLSFSLNWNSKAVVLKGSVNLKNPPQSTTSVIISDGFNSSLKEDDSVKIITFSQLSEILTNKESKNNWHFDKLFAHPSLLSSLKTFARILSAKNCFPTLKGGTLTERIDLSIVKDLSSRIELKTDKNGNLNILLGKTAFSDQQIIDNFRDIIKSVFSLKPSNWKGDFLKKLTISSTTSPGIKVSSIF